MPRALRGRFEPLDHFVLGHLYHPWASLCPWVAARRKAVHWLAIGVRTRSRASCSHLRITSCLRCATEQLARSSASWQSCSRLGPALTHFPLNLMDRWAEPSRPLTSDLFRCSRLIFQQVSSILPVG